MTLILRAAWLWLMVPASAWAYLDAGTGAYIGQLLIMVVTGVLVFIRHPIQTLKNLLARLRDRTRR